MSLIGRQITFANNQNTQYCQILLDDGYRILISVAEGTVKISTLKWHGTIPDELLCEINIPELNKNLIYIKTLRYLHIGMDKELGFSNESLKYGFNQLDVCRSVLMRCNNMDELINALNSLYYN